MITMGYDDLAARIGAAHPLGSRAEGTPLAPDTARKIACDAGIIPVVLGRGGEVLDQGRAERLFTLAQVRALWLQDRHCTFPGCDAPAAWCDAHHLIHWIDGGTTDLGNAALLCPRHHTVAHRDRLAGCRTVTGVCWDTRPGSYRARRPPPGAPPPAPGTGPPHSPAGELPLSPATARAPRGPAAAAGRMGA